MLDETQRNDPGQARRVEALRGRSADLVRRLDAAKGRLEGLLARDLDVPKGSEEATRGAEELRAALLQRIVDVRAHRGEVDTWFAEASYRDRGVKD